ncbi:MAG: nicotinamide riboside transporter PnuC [Prevotellaceae bacterium]|jgi:nicotinamide mononucleotide transporter|nr:nicotinamide riboside transporter PnuC [Prevotellaceae bacterium]
MGDNILFSLGDFQVSLVLSLEIIASILTFLCILFAVKEKIWTFPIGMIGTAMYFFVFFMQRVYSSMTLQIMFFAFNAYGLYKWTHPGKKDSAKSDNTLAVTLLTSKSRVLTIVIIAVLTMALGYVMSNLNNWLPALFPEEAKYVYIDTSILAASLVAQYLMAIKKLENWAIWFAVDIVSAPFYFITVGWATGILYLVFIFTAVMGWIEWKKSYKSTSKDTEFSDIG